MMGALHEASVLFLHLFGIAGAVCTVVGAYFVVKEGP